MKLTAPAMLSKRSWPLRVSRPVSSSPIDGQDTGSAGDRQSVRVRDDSLIIKRAGPDLPGFVSDLQECLKKC